MYKFQMETPNADDIFGRNNYGLSGRVRSYFPSNVIGSQIVNAATGDVYRELVGSKGEEKYFRVIDATGRFDENGRSIGQNCNNPNSNKLFYLSKAQYIEHIISKKRNLNEEDSDKHNDDEDDEDNEDNEDDEDDEDNEDFVDMDA